MTAEMSVKEMPNGGSNKPGGVLHELTVTGMPAPVCVSGCLTGDAETTCQTGPRPMPSRDSLFLPIPTIMLRVR